MRFIRISRWQAPVDWKNCAYQFKYTWPRGNAVQKTSLFLGSVLDEPCVQQFKPLGNTGPLDIVRLRHKGASRVLVIHNFYSHNFHLQIQSTYHMRNNKE